MRFENKNVNLCFASSYKNSTTYITGTVVCREGLFLGPKFWFCCNIFLWTCCMSVIFSQRRKAMLEATFRYLEHLHTTSEKFSRATLKKVFRWKSIFSKIFIRIFWELDTLKNSIFSLLVQYLLIYASYVLYCFADA